MRAPLCIGIVALVVSAGLLSGADEPKPPAKPAGKFAGRLVVVQSKGGIKSATLENAAIRPLGGRSFLVGKAVADGFINPPSYFTGTEVWVPVNDIESLAVFDNLGQLKRTAGQ